MAHFPQYGPNDVPRGDNIYKYLTTGITNKFYTRISLDASFEVSNSICWRNINLVSFPSIWG